MLVLDLVTTNHKMGGFGNVAAFASIGWTPYVRAACTHVITYIYMQDIPTQTHSHTQVNAHDIYMHMHADAHIYAHMHMHMRMHLHMHTHTYINASRIHTCAHIYAHAHITKSEGHQ